MMLPNKHRSSPLQVCRQASGLLLFIYFSLTFAHFFLWIHINLELHDVPNSKRKSLRVMDVREENQIEDVSSLPSSRTGPVQTEGRRLCPEGDMEDGAKRDRPLPIHLKVIPVNRSSHCTDCCILHLLSPPVCFSVRYHLYQH